MKEYILFYGVASMLMWGFIYLRAFRNSPITWASPTCLFAGGILLFYIGPSLYWQFRPWDYIIPSYFEGLPIFLKSLCLFGMSFLVVAVLSPALIRNKQQTVCSRTGEFGKKLWVFVFPVLFGMGWRIYLLTLGWQGRLSREVPAVCGSESLALIFYNVPYYYAICYFVLIAFGGKKQRQVGMFLWAFDGLFQIFLMHRYWMCLFVIRSIIFATLCGIKLRWKHWVIIGMFGIFVIAVVGKSHVLTYNKVEGGRRFLSVSQVFHVFAEAGVGYARGDFRGRMGSSSDVAMLRALDDTMFRLYQARSASAVMISVPNVIPYFYGKTFVHILYAMIPRYFCPNKPDLGEIQKVTTLVMPYDEGVNPAGTIAEFYMNYGFVAVFFGGIICLLLCRWIERILKHPERINLAWVCVYPIWAEQFLIPYGSFSRRICESFRSVLVLAIVALVLKYCRKQDKKEV
ncbi:MAG: hypothetical protein KJ995_08345 [Candidatus Omnitrophica bacterium]|nr:hypothetical protein [Candidatus Omnitrophota bacterium]MBU1127561.1 hypothetical protein [Candidatus Omnitrophota bacterium]MBU1852397.1 hypothetical protein [Candidatus Omnitrophota bacterium]